MSRGRLEAVTRIRLVLDSGGCRFSRTNVSTGIALSEEEREQAPRQGTEAWTAQSSTAKRGPIRSRRPLKKQGGHLLRTVHALGARASCEIRGSNLAGSILRSEATCHTRCSALPGPQCPRRHEPSCTTSSSTS